LGDKKTNMAGTWSFTTSLSPDVCLSRLRESLSPVPVFVLRMPKRETFYGTAWHSRFRVSVLRPSDVHDSFIPFLYGSVSSAPRGSIVKCSIGPHMAIYVFITLWSGAALSLIAFLAWAALTSTGHFNVHPLRAMAFVAFVGLLGWAAFIFGTRLGRSTEDALREFVASTLEADEAALGGDA
jgi:hypothetical protein